MRQPAIPPAGRSRLWQVLSRAATAGELRLPRCPSCGTYQYPLRELCRRCLSPEIEWAAVSGRGTLLSWTVVHASIESFFRSRPWKVAKLKLEEGPVVIAHLSCTEPVSGMAVQLHNCIGAGGGAVLVATLPGGTPGQDVHLKELLG